MHNSQGKAPIFRFVVASLAVSLALGGCSSDKASSPGSSDESSPERSALKPSADSSVVEDEIDSENGNGGEEDASSLPGGESSGETSDGDTQTGSTKSPDPTVIGQTPAEIPDPVSIEGVASFETPAAATKRLYGLWQKGDPKTASSEDLAPKSELDKLFAQTPARNIEDLGCDDGEFGTSLCLYDGSKGGISLTVVLIDKEWRINEIDAYSKDSDS